MVNINSIDKLSALLANLFFIGMRKSYSYDYIEERIDSSSFVRSLEDNNDDSFLYLAKTSDIVLEFFPHLDKEEIDNLLLNNNAMSLWLGDIYIRLFFRFHKSFSFLFLYMPLSLATYSFDVYHEMDFSNFYLFFEELINKKTIIEMLMNKDKLSYEQLSILTGIKRATLMNYSRSNEPIYNTKYEYLFLLSKVFNVNVNIFAKDIYNEPSSDMYRYNKEDPIFRSKLGLLFCKYYDKAIRDTEYSFDSNNNIYISSSSSLKVIWTNYKEGQGLVFSNNNDNIITIIDNYLNNISSKDNIANLNLVVFEFDGMSESINYYLKLSNRGLNNIFIINQQYFFQINKSFHKTRTIDNRVNEFLIQRARLLKLN